MMKSLGLTSAELAEKSRCSRETERGSRRSKNIPTIDLLDSTTLALLELVRSAGRAYTTLGLTVRQTIT